MKVGMIICERYKGCAGGKCFRSMRNREGAFERYKKDEELITVGYTSCGGCPGGNVEYAPEEMIRNGAEAIHLATGLVVGYPPCPHTSYFKEYIEKKFGVEVVIGTHPIPQKYFIVHDKLGSWDTEEWQRMIRPTLCSEELRKRYD
ncbi:MAG: CGGC domain-containing protein [Candidatus Thermoplasmatota archaeon]|jgi:predicted metal-binding protein|nr:CGGC domain-containing protein [Candidatus Thermoplasmatota archaeon]